MQDRVQTFTINTITHLGYVDTRDTYQYSVYVYMYIYVYILLNTILGSDREARVIDFK